MLGVQVGEDRAELRAEHGVQRGRRVLDDGHLGAVAAGGGGDLQADPARAGDHQVAVLPAEAGQHVLEPLGVREAAQVVDTGQVGAGDVEAARFRAGGEQQLVVRQDGAVAQRDGAGRAVQVHDRLAEVELDVVLGVPGGLLDEHRVALGAADQVALGQRRPFVGVVAFVADQYHPAGETLGAQRLRGFRPGEPRSDDHEGLVRVHHSVPPQGVFGALLSVPHGASTGRAPRRPRRRAVSGQASHGGPSPQRR